MKTRGGDGVSGDMAKACAWLANASLRDISGMDEVVPGWVVETLKAAMKAHGAWRDVQRGLAMAKSGGREDAGLQVFETMARARWTNGMLGLAMT